MDRLAGQVQVFKLAALVDEYAYLLAADYAASLAAARAELQARCCKHGWLLNALIPATKCTLATRIWCTVHFPQATFCKHLKAKGVECLLRTF